MNDIVLASYCVIEKEGKILLLKGIEKDGNVTGWTLPGGKIEEGELITENVLREVNEETALEVRLTGFIYIDEYKDSAGPGRVRLFFTGKCSSGDLSLQEGEIAEAKWFPLGEAGDLKEEDFHLPPYFEAVRRYLAKEVYPRKIFQTIKK